MITALVLASALAQAGAGPTPEDEARRAWRWYAGAWAVNSASTLAAVHAGGRESNPLFRDHHERAIIAKAGAAAVSWRLEVWAAQRGHPKAGKVGRWIFVGLSAVTAGYEFTISW